MTFASSVTGRSVALGRFFVLFTSLLLCAVPQVSAELKPFTLPWADALRPPPAFGGLSPPPAGADGWITADAAGHFVVAGRRERMLGVNITAAAAFPPKAKADAI